MPRKSLSEQIAEFSNPAPRSVDPEALTNFDDGTASHLDPASKQSALDDYGDDASYNNTDGRLTLRAEPDALDDPKYAGVAVSRRTLKPDGFVSDSETSGSQESDSVSSRSSSSNSENSEESDESDYSDVEMGADRNKGIDTVPSEDELDQQLDLLSHRRNKTNSNSGKDGSPNGSVGVAGNVQHLHNKEKIRAHHTHNQKKLWGDLLEIRMRMQPLLELGNRLPSADVHNLFHDHSDENLDGFESAVDSLSALVRQCINLRKSLSERHPDISALKPTRKRKRLDENSIEDLWDEIETGYDNFKPYQSAVISRWNKKTQLQSGMALHKKFKVVNQGILTQIESVLADQARLKKRTRIRRMDGVSIGHTLLKNTANSVDKESEDLVKKKESSPDMDLDYEIFDDTDFFKNLRQEYLESTMSSDDLLAVSKAFAMQSRRTKKKKKVDTRATKGRRMRYVVMPKLLNFMAPEYVTAPDIDVDVLFSSLFR